MLLSARRHAVAISRRGAMMNCIGDDSINAEIWSLSRTLQRSISLDHDASHGAQQAMPKPEHRPLFGPENPLPWVPDLVGTHYADDQGVLVVGSSYNGFISGYSARTRTMDLQTYADCRDNETSGLQVFTEQYLRSVVSGDTDYYQPILQDLMGAAGVTPERVCLTDLCKASFVEQGLGRPDLCRDDIGSDAIVRRHWEHWTHYVRGAPEVRPADRAPYRWLWGRMQQTRTVIALGTIAEYGVLKMFCAMAENPKATAKLDPAISPDMRALGPDRPWKYAYACPARKLRDWLTLGDWWRLEAGPASQPRHWSLLPVYHPSVAGREGDVGYVATAALLAQMIQNSQAES